MAEKEYDAEVSELELDDLVLEDLSADEEDDDNNVKYLPAAQAGGGVEKSKRITTPYMTKYERARVLGKYHFSQISFCHCSFLVNCLINYYYF